MAMPEERTLAERLEALEPLIRFLTWRPKPRRTTVKVWKKGRCSLCGADVVRFCAGKRGACGCGGVIDFTAIDPRERARPSKGGSRT